VILEILGMTINDGDAPDKSSPSLSKKGTEGEFKNKALTYRGNT